MDGRKMLKMAALFGRTLIISASILLHVDDESV